MLPLIIKGILIGLTVAAPVGPMALLCLKLSLERGIGAGIAAGLGIAIADTYLWHNGSIRPERHSLRPT